MVGWLTNLQHFIKDAAVNPTPRELPVGLLDPKVRGQGDRCRQTDRQTDRQADRQGSLSEQPHVLCAAAAVAGMCLPANCPCSTAVFAGAFATLPLLHLPAAAAAACACCCCCCVSCSVPCGRTWTLPPARLCWQQQRQRRHGCRQAQHCWTPHHRQQRSSSRQLVRSGEGETQQQRQQQQRRLLWLCRSVKQRLMG
jgi:hypothetical protein